MIDKNLTRLFEDFTYNLDSSNDDRESKEERLASLRTQLDIDTAQLSDDEKEAIQTEIIQLEQELDEGAIDANSEIPTEESANLTESSDANQDFLDRLRDLLEKYCRVSIDDITLSEDGNIVTINGQQIPIEGNSNLATIKQIIEFLLK